MPIDRASKHKAYVNIIYGLISSVLIVLFLILEEDKEVEKKKIS